MAAGQQAGHAALAEVGADEVPSDRGTRGSGWEAQRQAVGILLAVNTFSVLVTDAPADIAAGRGADAVAVPIAQGRKGVPRLTDSRRLLIAGAGIVSAACALALLPITDARTALIFALAGVTDLQAAEGIGFRLRFPFLVFVLFLAIGDVGEPRAADREPDTGEAAHNVATGGADGQKSGQGCNTMVVHGDAP